MELKNFPKESNRYEFCVARQVGDDLCFYSMHSNAWEAERVALEIHGVIVHNVRIQNYKEDDE